MGTNFYINGHTNSDDPCYHIGKRSAAGPYCWDCRRTLCVGGESKVHYESSWFERCPSCGKYVREETLEESSLGRELGFNKSIPKRKTGVISCSSFSWAMEVEQFNKLDVEGEEKIIEDEYGDLYSWEEFQQVLEECPIQFFDSIGENFS